MNAIIQDLLFYLKYPVTGLPQYGIAYAILPIFRNYLVNVTIFRIYIFEVKYVFIFPTTCI